MPVDPSLFTLPPSANACWRNFKGRVILSEKYRQWREENLHHVDDQNKIEACLFPVDVLIMVYPGKNWRKSDLDNRIKPILDQLQHCGLIKIRGTEAQRIRKWQKYLRCQQFKLVLGELALWQGNSQVWK